MNALLRVTLKLFSGIFFASAMFLNFTDKQGRASTESIFVLGMAIFFQCLLSNLKKDAS
jgi:hypothetical protein